MRQFWRQQRSNEAPKDANVKIKVEKPPVWDSVCGAFRILPKEVVFTYGDTIYNPDNADLPGEIIEHEKIHMEQQGHNETDAALWWGKYLRDPQFRIDQEARAYGKQYQVAARYINDRDQLARYVHGLAMSLSGPLYGKAIDFTEAILLIKTYSGVK